MDQISFDFIDKQDLAEIERVFLEVNVNKVNAEGYTPLYYACMKRNVSVATVEKLFSIGAEVSARSSDNETPLYIACFNGKIDVVLLLLDNGANVNTQNGNDNETALHAAARAGNSALIDILVSREANVNAQNIRKETPLYMAAKNGFHDAVYHLMKAGANVDICDIGGKSPLYIASERGLKHVVILLKSSIKDLDIAKARSDEELRLRPSPLKSTELILEEAVTDAEAGRPIHHHHPSPKREAVKETKPLDIVEIVVPHPKGGSRNPFASTTNEGPCRSLEEVGYDEPPAIPPSLMNRPPAKQERVGGTAMRIGTSVDTQGVEPPTISCLPGDSMEFSLPKHS